MARDKKRTVCCTVLVLSLLFSFRHVAEHMIHPRSELKKEQFSFANGISYFSIKYKLGIGVCFLFEDKQGPFSEITLRGSS